MIAYFPANNITQFYKSILEKFEDDEWIKLFMNIMKHKNVVLYY